MPKQPLMPKVAIIGNESLDFLKNGQQAELQDLMRGAHIASMLVTPRPTPYVDHQDELDVPQHDVMLAIRFEDGMDNPAMRAWMRDALEARYPNSRFETIEMEPSMPHLDLLVRQEAQTGFGDAARTQAKRFIARVLSVKEHAI